MPRVLALARQCERWGVEAILGQDPPYKTLIQMSHAVYTYDVVRAVEGAVGDRIHQVPMETKKFYWQLREKGYV